MADQTNTQQAKTRNNDRGDGLPSLEQLAKRIEELERRIAAIEDAPKKGAMDPGREQSRKVNYL